MTAAHFTCNTYHIALAVQTCAKMHRKAHGSLRPGHDAVTVTEIARCKGCDIGKHHRSGKPHPDVQLVTITPKPSGKAIKLGRRTRWDEYDGNGALMPFARKVRSRR